MLRIRSIIYLQRRCKGKKIRWWDSRKKTTTDRALANFDDFYGSVFGPRWKNMRVALLCEHKYIAMVNNFGSTEKTCSLLEMDGAINVKSLIQLAKERSSNSIDSAQSLQSNNVELDSHIDEILKKQEEHEVMSIYSEAAADHNVPKTLKYGEDNTLEENNISNNNRVIDYKALNKSLETAMKENSKIDYSRLVTPELGSGALHEYMPATRIKGIEDWIPESQYYRYYPTKLDFPLSMELEMEFQFPENLSLYTYEMGNCSRFRSPTKCVTGVLSHYLMDGASILPPLFLDVRPGESVLDACSAPGGKALLMLQTLKPDTLVCNDIKSSRLGRIRKVMQEYLFDYEKLWENKSLILQQSDVQSSTEYDSYDKILVDVPCTTDRHTLIENDNNIFKSMRTKERLRMPELQADILTNCLRLLKTGGSLVYSTCSLSPIQNDGVVHMALQRAFSEHSITTTVKDLSLSTQLFSDIFKFEQPKGLKYGQMVVPYLPANFGPMYFSKITRNT